MSVLVTAEVVVVVDAVVVVKLVVVVELGTGCLFDYLSLKRVFKMQSIFRFETAIKHPNL